MKASPMYPQQQYPQYPQGYGQQPYAAPVPQQQYPQQGYGQSAMPPAAPAPTVAADANLVDAPTGKYDGPRIADIGPGRLVIIEPLIVERVRNTMPDAPPDAMQDRVTANIVIVDGQPFPYGGAPEKGRPHNTMSPVPARYEGIMMSQAGLVQAVRKTVQANMSIAGTGQPNRIVIGRLSQGAQTDPKKHAPWQLTSPTPEEQAYALQILARVVSAPAAAQTPAPVQAPPQQQYPPAQYPAPQQQYPPAQYAAPMPQQQYSAPPVPPAPAPADGPPAGSGIPPAVWATWSPAQKAPFQTAAPAAPAVPVGEEPPW